MLDVNKFVSVKKKTNEMFKISCCMTRHKSKAKFVTVTSIILGEPASNEHEIFPDRKQFSSFLFLI